MDKFRYTSHKHSCGGGGGNSKPGRARTPEKDVLVGWRVQTSTLTDQSSYNVLQKREKKEEGASSPY